MTPDELVDESPTSSMTTMLASLVIPTLPQVPDVPPCLAGVRAALAVGYPFVVCTAM